MSKNARTTFRSAADVKASGATTAKRVGRRAIGPAGARVSDYPPVMIRLPHGTKENLEALSGITGVPVWQLVDRAVTCYLAQLPSAEQKLVVAVRARRAQAG